MPSKSPSVFFLGLTGIDLPATGYPGTRISDRLRITNDRAAVLRMVGEYAEFTGYLEQRYLAHHAKAVVYSRENVALPKVKPAESINGLIIQRLGEIQTWLMQLWLIKDNAVDPDIGWMAVNIAGKPAVNSNRWTTAFCKADGSVDVVRFTKDELEAVRKVPIEPDNIADGTPIALHVPGASDPSVTKLSHSSLRFQRFLYYVAGARATRDVAIKIAHYCSGLEAIVSSSHSELTHQVAERAAILLRERGIERLETYRKVKQAYAMRSKAVHGATFKDKDYEKLTENSVHIDQICREVGLAFFADAEFQNALAGKDTEFNEYWVAKLFLD